MVVDCVCVCVCVCVALSLSLSLSLPVCLSLSASLPGYRSLSVCLCVIKSRTHEYMNRVQPQAHTTLTSHHTNTPRTPSSLTPSHPLCPPPTKHR